LDAHADGRGSVGLFLFDPIVRCQDLSTLEKFPYTRGATLGQARDKNGIGQCYQRRTKWFPFDDGTGIDGWRLTARPDTHGLNICRGPINGI
jgi:hypothetical protein